MPATRNRAALLGALAVACATTTLTACGKQQPDSAQSQKQTQNQPPEGVKIHAYTVRGEVTALPGDDSDLMVRHEAIPEFVRPDGTLGMDTMIMPFWPPAGVSLEDARVHELDLDDIAVGDKVTLTFEVMHDEETGALKGYYATKVEKLPADTVLDFSHLDASEH